MPVIFVERNDKNGGKNSSLVVTTAAPGPTTPGSEVWWNVRLPKDIVPEHYDVVLYIDLENSEFFGNVAIRVTVLSSTENVLVHVNKMNITSASVEKASGGGK